MMLILKNQTIQLNWDLIRFLNLGRFILDNGKMEEDMELESFIILKDLIMRVHLEMTSLMVEVDLCMKQVMYTREI